MESAPGQVCHWSHLLGNGMQSNSSSPWIQADAVCRIEIGEGEGKCFMKRRAIYSSS